MDKKYEYIKTNNIPLIDEVIYYLKKIITECVIKNKSESDKYENIKSKKHSDLYLYCIEDNVNFNMFKYTKEIIMKCGIIEELAIEYEKDNSLIPDNIRNQLLNITKKEFINNYIEYNNYYRMLNGQPNINEQGFLLTKDFIPGINVRNNEYIHNLNDDEIDLLYYNGVIDNIKNMFPEYKYLNYLGNRKIDIYDARVSTDFSLLYIPEDVPDSLSSRFKEKYKINQVYTTTVVYNDAFKISSDYYDNFIQIFILVQTVVDILAELPDIIIKREFFDIKTIELMFKSHGVDFFPEIPYRYQYRMMKNLHTLIKYKSTTKNIVDICSLFGFDNIFIFKYYLLKDRKVTEDGDFIFKYIKNEEGEIVEEDLDEMYELKFLKVPIDDIPDNFLSDKSKYRSYDDITLGDKYWNGDLDPEEVKKTILSKEFNYLQSKYLSVDTLYSMSELQFQITYFHNMIFDKRKVEDSLKIKISKIDSYKRFKLTDVFVLLYSLMYEYIGFEDTIHIHPEQILHIKGFNFEVDIDFLNTYITNKGYTLEDLGVDDFIIPESNLATYDQLVYIFTQNRKVYNHIVNEMNNADNKDIYDIYKLLYDSLMICDLTNDFFKLEDGYVCKTYTEYLKYNDIVLYDFINNIREVKDKEQRNERISIIINDIIYIIEHLLDSDDLKYIFSIFPSANADSIKKYIYKVIDFFKSYKVQIESINSIYVFDDFLENKINIIDKILIRYIYHKSTLIEISDKIKYKTYINYTEMVQIIDKLVVDVNYWNNLIFQSEVIDTNRAKDIIDIIISFIKKDNMNVNDDIQYNILTSYVEYITQICNTILNIKCTNKTDIEIKDYIHIKTIDWVFNLYSSYLNIGDNLNIKTNLYKKTNFQSSDYIRFLNKYNLVESNMFIDKINSSIFDIHQSYVNIYDKILLNSNYYNIIIYKSIMSIEEVVSKNIYFGISENMSFKEKVKIKRVYKKE